MSFLVNPYWFVVGTGRVNAEWTGNTPSYWTVSNPSVTKVGGGSGDYAYAQSSSDTFGSFVMKWNGGSTSATINVAISTIAYLNTHGTGDAGCEYGFKVKPDGSDYFMTILAGTADNYEEMSITTDTEFKLVLDGTTMTWYVDDVAKHTATSVTLSGDYYLWSNANNSATNPSWQATWAG